MGACAKGKDGGQNERSLGETKNLRGVKRWVFEGKIGVLVKRWKKRGKTGFLRVEKGRPKAPKNGGFYKGPFKRAPKGFRTVLNF